MPKKIAVITVSLALVVSAVLAQTNETTAAAVISGQVLDSDRTEVPNAQVAAFLIPVGSSAIAGNISWTPTDDHGRFRITLRPGRYIIRAKAEQSGYPNPDALLSADPSARFPTISVEQSDLSAIVVILGKKGAVLEGYTYDAQSRAAISGSKVTLQDVRNSRAIVELTTDKSGHFQFTIPAKPIFVFASAPGFKSVRFAKGQPLTLSSGEHRSISIELNHD